MSQMAICLIIFCFTIIGYCSGKYSLATIAMTSMTALTVTGCMTAKDALGYFGNSTVIMIAGMSIIAAGFNKTRFCVTLANKISSISKGSLARMMMGYMIIGMLLSQFIQSPVVVFGIVAPMLAASAESIGVKSSKVMLPLGMITSITCCTLPIGSGATVATELNGYLESYGYTDYVVGLMDPMKARLPLLIVMVFYCALVATKFAPDEPITEVSYRVKKGAEKEILKPFQEYAGIIIFFASAVALMFAGKLGLTTWQVTMIGALAMILCGVLKPKEATASLPMSMLILIVGALSISGALSATGAGQFIGDKIAVLVNAVNGNSYVVGAIFFIVPFVLTQVMNNRGTMLVFMPIAIATCASIGANPIGVINLVQASSLAAFLTPMATASVPLVMSYGGYDQKSLFKQGWLPSLIACVVSVGWIMTVFPL